MAQQAPGNRPIAELGAVGKGGWAEKVFLHDRL